jgi:hypothetical protein
MVVWVSVLPWHLQAAVCITVAAGQDKETREQQRKKDLRMGPTVSGKSRCSSLGWTETQFPAHVFGYCWRKGDMGVRGEDTKAAPWQRASGGARSTPTFKRSRIP